MDVLDVALLAGEALDRVGVGYFLGGSLASSLQGEPRATNDIDLVVDLAEPQVVPLAAALGPDFELDPVALARAVRARGSWTCFHLPTVTKLDLFVAGVAPFDRSEFSRRRRMVVRGERSLFVKSAEDTVLRKLLWYRSGGEVSERQWRDVVQVLRVSRAVLDGAYLGAWADRLDLAPLLRRAQGEAGPR